MARVIHHMPLSSGRKHVSFRPKSAFAEPRPPQTLSWCHRLSHHAHVQRNVSYAAAGVGSAQRSSPIVAEMPKAVDPLSILPLPHLIRSYLITTISSSPTLLRTSLRALKFLAHTRSPFFNPDRSPSLHFLLKRTIYGQFCAGETAGEVGQTINRLKSMGYSGVMLGYAREACTAQTEAGNLKDPMTEQEADAVEVTKWAKGNLATVQMAQAGDFVTLKFTGAGGQALRHLTERKPPPSSLRKTTTEICELARARKVRLLFDAEQDAVQAGIDGWTIEYMRRYNCEGEAVVYGTYQAYKRSTPGTLAQHLELAREENFVLGVKLVRGAYLGSDPRHLFWDTIEGTHSTYDGIAESLLRRAYNDTLRPVSPAAAVVFPSVNLVLAGHNHESVTKAQKIRNAQVSAGEPRIVLAYGQLMGMAENISCALVQAGQVAKQTGQQSSIDIPAAYQYLVWGSVGECSQYLVRRAQENKDAVTRTKDGRRALGRELLSRLGLSA